MKHSLKIMVLPFVVAGPWALGQVRTAAPAPKVQLESLQNLQKRGVKVSALVFKLRDGQMVAQLNPDKRLCPASVSKVVTASAALEKWGADKTFDTRFLTQGRIQNHTLHGDLIFEGNGDPWLTNEKLWYLTSDLARRGITEVTGKLVLNTAAFGKSVWDVNRKAGQKASAHAYDAPLSAVALNFNVFAVVASGNASGEPAALAMEPFRLGSLPVKGQIQTGPSTSAGKISASRDSRSGVDQITVGGSVPAEQPPQRKYLSVSNPEVYARDVLQGFLSASGIRLRGGSAVDANPPAPEAWTLASVEGFPLAWQLGGLLKLSNNFIADMLTIQLDRDAQKMWGATLQGGSQKLESYLAQVLTETRPSLKPQQPEGDPVLASGSGLTPENRLSARDVVAVLDRMYFNAREFPAFLSALPIAGAEGTVKKRFAEPSQQHLQPRVRAKTGTLTDPVDCIALAGYSRTSEGDWVAFALIANGSEGSPNPGPELLRSSMDEDLARALPPEF